MEAAVLDDAEQDTIRRCMIAVLEGPFIDDAEFQTRLGIDRQTLSAILADPDFDYRSQSPDVELAINNCMNEIAHGIRIPSAEWAKWFAVTPEDVRHTFLKWLTLRE